MAKEIKFAGRQCNFLRPKHFDQTSHSIKLPIRSNFTNSMGAELISQFLLIVSKTCQSINRMLI